MKKLILFVLLSMTMFSCSIDEQSVAIQESQLTQSIMSDDVEGYDGIDPQKDPEGFSRQLVVELANEFEVPTKDGDIKCHTAWTLSSGALIVEGADGSLYLSTWRNGKTVSCERLMSFLDCSELSDQYNWV